MTREEAAELAEKAIHATGRENWVNEWILTFANYIEEATHRRLRAQVLAEREACAVLADEMALDRPGGNMVYSGDVATAIRSRK